MLHEVTEARVAAKTLSEARADADRRAAEFRSFITSMADGLLVCDADEEIVFANEAAKAILSLKQEEQISGSLADYKRYYADGTSVRRTKVRSIGLAWRNGEGYALPRGYSAGHRSHRKCQCLTHSGSSRESSRRHLSIPRSKVATRDGGAPEGAFRPGSTTSPRCCRMLWFRR